MDRPGNRILKDMTVLFVLKTTLNVYLIFFTELHLLNYLLNGVYAIEQMNSNNIE